MSAVEIIAKKFVQARLEAGSLARYPGAIPEALSEAYAIQDVAINLWPDEIAGWKVGRINGADVDRYGTDRLAGPIFAAHVRKPAGEVLSSPVFERGFAAVEGECVILVAEDTDPLKTDYSTEDAIALIGSIHVGVEIASSPFPGINDHGPLVTISDFGNNFGLIIGAELPGWQSLEFDVWPFETQIDGESVGQGVATSIPGGPVESLRFMLENAALRGMPLKKGMAISTGAVTGVHVAGVGQTATVTARGAPAIELRLAAAAMLTDVST